VVYPRPVNFQTASKTRRHGDITCTVVAWGPLEARDVTLLQVPLNGTIGKSHHINLDA